jgi:hypothetical protein
VVALGIGGRRDAQAPPAARNSTARRHMRFSGCGKFSGRQAGELNGQVFRRAARPGREF